MYFILFFVLFLGIAFVSKFWILRYRGFFSFICDWYFYYYRYYQGFFLNWHELKKNQRTNNKTIFINVYEAHWSDSLMLSPPSLRFFQNDLFIFTKNIRGGGTKILQKIVKIITICSKIYIFLRKNIKKLLQFREKKNFFFPKKRRLINIFWKRKLEKNVISDVNILK